MVRRQQRQAALAAPHFVWYVREELRERLCGEAETCTALEQGGLRVVTTLDWDIQQVGREVGRGGGPRAASGEPAPPAAKALRRALPALDARLRDQNVWNGALSAPSTTRRARSSPTSARRTTTSDARWASKIQPQFDVLSAGWRQPGSAFKPFNYATGIDDESLTASTMFMDVTTDFGGVHAHRLRQLERGPLRVRNALQFSLNIPAVKALAHRSARTDVFEMAEDFGMDFQRRRPTAGLSMALGTPRGPPARPQRRLRHARQRRPRPGRHRDPVRSPTRDGEEVLPPYEAAGGRARSSREQAAYVVTDILAGNTDPAVNPIWAAMRITTTVRAPPAGGAQDGHQQRRQGPLRLRLHRAALGTAAASRASTR